MSDEWEKSETSTGIPYYVNHITERTQWDHPDLVRYLHTLESVNNIHFAAYRTAMKLRMLQKLLHLDVVDLAIVNMAFEQHGFQYYNDTVMDTVQLYNIIYEMYFLTKSRGRSKLNVSTCSELLLNWILNLYDMNRTGCLRVLSIKIGMSVLCAGKITDKYRYFYQQATDRAGGVSKKNMTALLQDLMQVSELIREAEPFGKNVNAVVSSCMETSFVGGSPDDFLVDLLFEEPSQASLTHEGKPIEIKSGKLLAQVSGSMVTKEPFMSWFMAEPQTIVWLPTMHRLATAETMKHEAKCNLCKVYPMVGFRYKCLKCLNYDLCQDCFFTGRTSQGHKYNHPTQEYCLGASSKEDVRAFAKTIRNKLSKKHGHRIKQKYLPIDDTHAEWYTRSHRSEPVEEVDTHIKMGQMSMRLAAVESMQPYDAYVALPDSAINQRQEAAQPPADENKQLEDLIDKLEQENEHLLKEMENLRKQRPLHLQDSGSSDDADSVRGRREKRYVGSDESPWQQNEMLKARQEVLEENKQELERQLHKLKESLRNKYLLHQVHGGRPSVPHLAPSGAPPPYASPHRSVGQTLNPLNRTTPPSIAHHSDHPDGDLHIHHRTHDSTPRGLDLVNRRQAPPYGVSLATTPGGIDQSNRGVDKIDNRQTHPDRLSLAGARGVDQSLAISALIGRNKLLPPHLGNQSSLSFPALGVSRTYPSEEDELEDLMQKLDVAYPTDFTYGCHGGHSHDMLMAATRVGQAMSSLVARVTAAE